MKNVALCGFVFKDDSSKGEPFKIVSACFSFVVLVLHFSMADGGGFSRGQDIFDAAGEGNVPALRHFLRRSRATAADDGDFTALHHAAANGCAAACRMLLAARAEAQAEAEDGRGAEGWYGAAKAGADVDDHDDMR